VLATGLGLLLALRGGGKTAVTDGPKSPVGVG